jgi:hypothetical protein
VVVDASKKDGRISTGSTWLIAIDISRLRCSCTSRVVVVAESSCWFLCTIRRLITTIEATAPSTATPMVALINNSTNVKPRASERVERRNREGSGII